MDGPTQVAHRKTVAPPLGPRNLKRLEPMIRERVVHILDGLPLDEKFDWVDRVSVELTTSMLASLFGFPFSAGAHISLVATLAVRFFLIVIQGRDLCSVT